MQQSTAAFRISESQTKANFDIWDLMHVPTHVPYSSYPETQVKLANISECMCTKETAIFIILSPLFKAKKETRKQVKIL